MTYMTGLIGTCQQLEDASSGGGGGSAPTSVSNATSSTGNYDNSFITYDVLGTVLTTDGSSTTMSIAKEPYDNEHGGGPASSFYVRAYLRATGGTSYTQNAAMNGDSSLTGCSVAMTTTNNSTSQDNTSSGGLGEVTITHGGGRGGFITPSINDFVRVKVNGSATNSNGTTNATQVIRKLKWVE